MEIKQNNQKPNPPQIPVESTLYQRNEARFFGEKQDDRASSRGSVFQKNAAHFYGNETPPHGQRPYEIPPPEPKVEPAAKPLLAQRKVI